MKYFKMSLSAVLLLCLQFAVFAQKFELCSRPGRVPEAYPIAIFSHDTHCPVVNFTAG